MKQLIKRSLLLFTIHLALVGISAQTEQKAALIVQTGQFNQVFSVAFSPDGKTLASGSWDKTIKLWDFETGKQLRTLTGHLSVVMSVDGKGVKSEAIKSGIFRVGGNQKSNLNLQQPSLFDFKRRKKDGLLFLLP